MIQKREGQILHCEFPIIKNEAKCLVTSFRFWSQYVLYLGNLLCPFTRKAEKQPVAPWLIFLKNCVHIRLFYVSVGHVFLCSHGNGGGCEQEWCQVGLKAITLPASVSNLWVRLLEGLWWALHIMKPKKVNGDLGFPVRRYNSLPHIDVKSCSRSCSFLREPTF